MTPLEPISRQDLNRIIKQNNSATRVYPPETVGGAPQTESTCSKDYRVSWEVYPIILVLQSLAACPIQIERKGHIVRYEFKLYSIVVSLSFVYFLTTCFLICLWVLNAVFDIDIPFRFFLPVARVNEDWLGDNLEKAPQHISIINTAVKVFLPVGAAIFCISQWYSLPHLCEYLNNWSHFFAEFNHRFSSHHNIQFNLARKRNIYTFVWILPLFAVWSVSYPVTIVYGGYLLHCLLGLFAIFVIIGCRSLFYVKDFFLLVTLKMAYEQVCCGMKAEYENYKMAIKAEQVRAWLDLLIFLRKQTSILETYISLPNLWSIFEVFVLVLMILSLIAHFFLNGMIGEIMRTSNFLPYTLTCVVFFTHSIYWKASIAEEIALAEERIAEEIIEMDTDDCETRLEMKLICDLIYNDPTQIKIGNAMVLNKRLFLSLFGQIASYMVIILQFSKLK